MIWPFKKGKTQPPVWPGIWKLVPVADVFSQMDYSKGLSIALLRQGCEILKISFVGGGVYFVNKGTPEIEMENLKGLLMKELNPNTEYVIAYSKEDKPHPNLAYYKIIAIRSNDLLDLKKALKVHKLKAFI